MDTRAKVNADRMRQQLEEDHSDAEQKHAPSAEAQDADSEASGEKPDPESIEAFIQS